VHRRHANTGISRKIAL